MVGIDVDEVIGADLSEMTGRLPVRLMAGPWASPTG